MKRFGNTATALKKGGMSGATVHDCGKFERERDRETVN